jgi:hypothetical protein
MKKTVMASTLALLMVAGMSGAYANNSNSGTNYNNTHMASVGQTTQANQTSESTRDTGLSLAGDEALVYEQAVANMDASQVNAPHCDDKMPVLHYQYDSGFGVREFNFTMSDEMNSREYSIEFTVRKGKSVLNQSTISAVDNQPFVVQVDREVPYIKSIKATEVKGDNGSGNGQIKYDIQKDVYHDGLMLSGIISPVVIHQPENFKGDESVAGDPVVSNDDVLVEAGITLNNLDAIQKQCIGKGQEQCIDLLFTNNKELQSREEVKIGQPVTIKLPQNEQESKRSFFDRLFGRNDNQISITYVVKHND